MSATALPPFHLALPVHDIDAARHFYGDVLAFRRGRSDERWTDWNVDGHQVVTHQVDHHVNAVSGTNLQWASILLGRCARLTSPRRGPSTGSDHCSASSRSTLYSVVISAAAVCLVLLILSSLITWLDHMRSRRRINARLRAVGAQRGALSLIELAYLGFPYLSAVVMALLLELLFNVTLYRVVAAPIHIQGLGIAVLGLASIAGGLCLTFVALSARHSITPLLVGDE